MCPEPCIKQRCYSPTACEGWGFCRERNISEDPIDENGQRPEWLILERRIMAHERKSETQN